MRKSYLLMSALLLIVFASCIKKENRIRHHLLEHHGKWAFSQRITVSGNGPNASVFNAEKTTTGTLLFDEKGTFIWDEGGVLQGGFWSTSKDGFTLIIDSDATQYVIRKSTHKQIDLNSNKKIEEIDGSLSDEERALHISKE